MLLQLSKKYYVISVPWITVWLTLQMYCLIYFYVFQCSLHQPERFNHEPSAINYWPFTNYNRWWRGLDEGERGSEKKASYLFLEKSFYLKLGLVEGGSPSATREILLSFFFFVWCRLVAMGGYCYLRSSGEVLLVSSTINLPSFKEETSEFLF